MITENNPIERPLKDIIQSVMILVDTALVKGKLQMAKDLEKLCWAAMRSDVYATENPDGKSENTKTSL